MQENGRHRESALIAERAYEGRCVELISVSSRLTRPGLLALCLTTSLAVATPARSQSVSDPAAAAPAASLVANDGADAAVLTRAEPAFVVVNLPSTLWLPLWKSNFRLTHRFAGNLRNGSFGQQAGNLFGIDQGAIIGFEYRMAVAKHAQAAFYRSSFDKTIQL